MKLFEKMEPNFLKEMNPKRAKRKSYKKDKILLNRAIRRELNRNFQLGKEICSRNLGFEY
jgi:hypothetical protein